MSNRFKECLKITMGFEGGYVNDPDDRGGQTNYGITAGTLRSAFKKGWVKHSDDSDVRKLKASEVAEIYRRGYWEPVGAPHMPQPLDLLMFDCAVNHGVGGAIRLLQEGLNSILRGNPLRVDGAIGPRTREALKRLVVLDAELSNAALEEHFLIRYLCLDVLMNRTELFDGIANRSSSQRKFLRGWIHHRVVELEKRAGMEE